ncbi:DUF2878 domain-containing protein [Ramlibacter sp. MAHUQ-53]|uniref:DUF2878 domain-containing protein n=1 Tax=unclassified Ramlibacter TaxID=2617605 RepID=UPI003639C6BF
MDRLINALGFQAGWWACVAGVASGYEVPALAFCGALALAHLYTSAQPAQEARLAGASLALGIPLDTLLQQFSVIDFHGLAIGPLSPLWLWMLWVLFALTLNSSLAFLQGRHWALSAALGLVFGPLAYAGGAALGAASFDGAPGHLAALAGAWMLALPALVQLACRKRRAQAPREAGAPAPLTPTRSSRAAWSSRRR